MTSYDVFNGDADGICALHQLRLAEPRPDAGLVTGVKRDIALLERLLEVRDAEITVLDISMASNRQPLLTLLQSCRVLYIDHHFAGDIPESKALTAHIDTDANVCTSLIVDRLLAGRYRAWAVAAAFGDNLHDAARRVAAEIGLAADAVEQLRELGELMNYNGYGREVADLHLTPEELYRAVQPYQDPLAFIAESAALPRLRQGFADDMALARGQAPFLENESGRVYRFPDAPWARRCAGVFSNERAREKPDLAHALAVDNGDGSWLVSVRAPMARKTGADTLCRAFPTGGGRAAAAGINRLPGPSFDKFLQSFTEVFTP